LTFHMATAEFPYGNSRISIWQQQNFHTWQEQNFHIARAECPQTLLRKCGDVCLPLSVIFCTSFFTKKKEKSHSFVQVVYE
jgi:hypothetical protein